MTVDLIEMKSGEFGIIKEITGGCRLSRRLQTLGIRPGKKITKISSYIGRGPQIILIDNTQIAIGFGMAKKILVEVDK